MLVVLVGLTGLFGASALWVLAYAALPPPVTPLMALHYLEGTAITRAWRPLDEISDHLVHAVIAAEDAKFCRHWGFDQESIRAAIVHNRHSERLIGGSTISQQTAKNAFLWPARSWLRKGLEAYFTGLLEILWSKRRVMEIYLNIAEWGDGIYGAEAAARYHFGKPAARLTRREAALMAVSLPAPRRRSPRRPSQFLRNRADKIEVGMALVARKGLAECVLGAPRPPPRARP